MVADWVRVDFAVHVTLYDLVLAWFTVATVQVGSKETMPVIRVTNHGNMRGSVRVAAAVVQYPSGEQRSDGEAVRLHPMKLNLEGAQDAAMVAEVLAPAEGDYLFRCELRDQVWFTRCCPSTAVAQYLSSRCPCLSALAPSIYVRMTTLLPALRSS